MLPGPSLIHQFPLVDKEILNALIEKGKLGLYLSSEILTTEGEFWTISSALKPSHFVLYKRPSECKES